MVESAGVKFTAKLPALLAGVVFFVLGLASICWRKSAVLTVCGIALLGIGFGFLYYSYSIKEWCVVNQGSAFSSAFAPSLRGCLRTKGIFEL